MRVRNYVPVKIVEYMADIPFRFECIKGFVSRCALHPSTCTRSAPTSGPKKWMWWSCLERIRGFKKPMGDSVAGLTNRWWEILDIHFFLEKHRILQEMNLGILNYYEWLNMNKLLSELLNYSTLLSDQKTRFPFPQTCRCIFCPKHLKLWRKARKTLSFLASQVSFIVFL